MSTLGGDAKPPSPCVSEYFERFSAALSRLLVPRRRAAPSAVAATQLNGNDTGGGGKTVRSGDLDGIAEDEVLDDSYRGSKEDHMERGMSTSSSDSDLMLVSAPFADAVSVPKKVAAKLAAVSTSSSTDSTDSHGDITADLQKHYNPDADVVLRWEFATERQMKGVLIGVWVVEALGLFFLLLGLSLKLTKDQRYFFRTRVVEITNVVIGVPCWLALFVGGVLYVHRVWRANRSGKRWSVRRKRVTQRIFLEHSIVLINVTAFLISNIYVVSKDCSWFHSLVVCSGIIQWSCWNAIFAIFVVHAHDSNPWIRCTRLRGFRPDAIIMDAPRTYHLPKLMAFFVVEGLLIALAVLNYNGDGNRPAQQRDAACQSLSYRCHPSTATTVLEVLIMVSFLAYFLAVIVFFRRAYAALRGKPYTSFRMANIHVRFQSRLRGLSATFFVLCLICYIYVGWGTCVSYIQSWLGFTPMILVITGVTAASTYLGMPNNPTQRMKILQIWLQEFSWTEKELPARLHERKSSLCSLGQQDIQHEPIFCFETSMKMLYWSMLVYRYEESDNRGVTLEAAMALYQLENFELFWERKLDTKALMSWNDDTIVLSFRGTASFKNVLADIRAWYAAHPPPRGYWWLGTRPFVHQGFLRSWLASGLRGKVVDRVQEIVGEMQAAGRSPRLLVTGHSLGGCLATLAAYDIALACPQLGNMAISCYTFGAPRVGNHAFARECSKALPQLWNVINDQDAVPRSGKFGILYKRPGQRVLINAEGDLIVRPSFVEAAAQRRATSSVAHHLLVNYQRAHIAIIKAQFTSKRLRGGMMGVLEIAEACGMQNLLKAAGVEYSHLRKLERLGDSGLSIPALLDSQSSSSASAASRGRFGSKKSAHLRKSSQSGFSVDFDLAAVAAAVDAEEAKVAAESPPAADTEAGDDAMQGGVNQLEGSSPSVQAAAAVAALGRGVAESPSPGEAEATLAAGGDLNADDGQPVDSPPQHTAFDIPSDDAAAASSPTPTPESPTPNVTATDSIPMADAPLQFYSGSLASGRCKYSHFNGMRCKKGGRLADTRTHPEAEGGICWMKDRPKQPDLVEGTASGAYCSMADRPKGLKKVAEVVGDGVNQLLGK